MTFVKKRNALSGGMEKALILRGTVAIALAVIAFGIFDSNSNIANIDTTKMKLEKISGETYITGTITNRGTDGIRDFEIELAVDTDTGTAGIQDYEPTLSTTSIDKGKLLIINSLVVDTGATAITLVQGDEYRVLYKGNSTSGRFQETGTLIVD